jgi:hypothetical protein
MIFNFDTQQPADAGIVLDLVEPPTGSAYRECYALGWLLSGPISIPGSKVYSTCLTRITDESDMRTFMESTPEKAVARALEAARVERKAA